MNELSFDLENCPIARVSKVLQGKWAMVIIYVLSEGTLRFSEIHHKLPHIVEGRNNPSTGDKSAPFSGLK